MDDTAAPRIDALDAHPEQRVVTLPPSLCCISECGGVLMDRTRAASWAALFYGTRSPLWRAVDLGIFDRRSTCRSFNRAGSWSITPCSCNNNKHDACQWHRRWRLELDSLRCQRISLKTCRYAEGNVFPNLLQYRAAYLSGACGSQAVMPAFL